MTNHILLQQATDALARYHQEGLEMLTACPVTLSHICFKFSDRRSYRQYLEAATKIGAVFQEEFNGKKINWCRLHQPLSQGDSSLKWLEIIEPKPETNPFSGVTALCYHAPGIDQVTKIQSADNEIVFRYQPNLVCPS